MAVKQGNKIWLGADTQSTRGTDRYNQLSPNDFKVIKLDNGVLLAMTGETATSQAILAHPEWFTVDAERGLTKEDIVTKIVPKMYEALEAEGLHSLEEMRGRNRFPAVVLDIATGKNETWWSYEDALEKLQDDWGIEMDELYKKALQIVIDEQIASMSLLQRKLSIGYNKAGRLIERMEEEHYVEEFKGGISRKVLITQAQFDERFHG